MMRFEKNECKEDPKYSHQEEADKAFKKMESEYGNFSTIVDLPTGGGKTRIATDFCVDVLGTNDNNKVLWLSDTIDLLTQSIDKFKEKELKEAVTYQLICGTSISFDGKKWKRNNSNSKNSLMTDIEEDTKILFASVETIRGYERPDENSTEDGENKKDKFSKFAEWLKKSQDDGGKLYIIYDEVHHIGAEKTEEFFRNFFETSNRCKAIVQNYAMIGLTGTVYRYDSPIESFNRWFKYGWDNQEERVVKESKNPIGDDEEGFINNRIKVVDIQKLIQEGILIEPKIIRVDDFENGMPILDEEEKKALEQKKTPKCDISEMKYLARKIASTYKKEKWNKTIIFIDGTKNAERLEEELSKLGVSSFAYTSDTVNSRDDDIVNFKDEGNKNTKIMIAVDMVSEGFDVKDIETIYLYSGVQSHIVLRQRIGRVLRKYKGKKEAKVYWQKYFKGVKKDRAIEDIAYKDIIEKKLDIQKDIGLWKKGMQLPAGIYLERLPIDEEEEKVLYIRRELLNMLELFGAKLVSDNMNYFICDDKKLYFRSQERKGYEQFYHMIVADYWSCLFKSGSYIKFDDYAKALKISRKKLLEDIKINCFYLANVRPSDTDGEVIKNKRFIVEDEDISCFYEWVVKNDLKMPEIGLAENSSPDTSEPESDKEDTNEEYPSEPENEKDTRKKVCEVFLVEEYMEGHPDEKKNELISAIQLQQKILKKNDISKFNAEKKYADTLRYGKKNKYIYQQLESARAILNCGAAYEKREIGKLGEEDVELAFIGRGEEGNTYPIKTVERTVNDMASGDSLFYAQAIVNVPNHICVRQADVTEYSNKLWNVLSSKYQLDEDKKNKVVNEFIMALGYQGYKTKNKKDRKYWGSQDDIIRSQCELFGDDVPRLLQYVIYCNVYTELAKEVKFYDKNMEHILTECQNVPDLESSYNKILKRLGFKGKMDSNLTPVEDVIEDYRPYIKAVPYYQGIKPEYLCRMLNDIMGLFDRQGYEFIDAFGGSGTISLNVAPNLEMKQSYNDLGMFNKAFFDILRDEESVKKFKGKVAELIDLVCNHTGDDTKTQKFFEPYVRLLNTKKQNSGDISCDECIEKVRKTINEETKDYTDDFKLEVDNHNSRKPAKKWRSLEERLLEKEEHYHQMLELVLECEEDTLLKLRDIEHHLHVIMLKINAIYDNLKRGDSFVFSSKYNSASNQYKTQDSTEYLSIDEKIDVAFIFYMFNTFSQRHFFNDSTINLLANFMGNYEDEIDNAHKVAKNITINGTDALDLIEKLSANEHIVWYHDIPYSETSAETYVDKWFDEVEFTDCLSKCAGDYIVASRFNICEKEKHKEQEDSSSKDNIEQTEATKTNVKVKLLAEETRTKKQYGLLKFFSRFVTEDKCKRYKEEIEREYKEIEQKVSKSPESEKYGWRHVKDSGKEAKYIVFALCQNEYRHHYAGEDEKQQSRKYFKKVSSLSVDSIRRMLKDTQFSDISVEIMITNMKLKEDENKKNPKYPVQKLEDGMWYLPTFKTNSTYMVEPVTIIMSYKKFYEEIVLNILSKAYEDVSTKEYAAAYRNLYFKQ